MEECPLVAIAAGSHLLRIGLERVVARAGLQLAHSGQPGTILLRAERPSDSRPPRDSRDPADGHLAELLVIGDHIEVRRLGHLSTEIQVAVERLIDQLSR